MGGAGEEWLRKNDAVHATGAAFGGRGVLQNSGLEGAWGFRGGPRAAVKVKVRMAGGYQLGGAASHCKERERYKKIYEILTARGEQGAVFALARWLPHTAASPLWR